MSMDNDGKYFVDVIRDGSATAVSDRSYKYSCSAAACMLEGPVPNLHSITVIVTSPGIPEI
eukprot:3850575-Ditylum_brightwellii.AAC.1